MAKYTVTQACGHDEVVALVGPISQREWRLENVEPQKLCSECYHAELARRREEENREAAEAAKEMSLPALTGTEKQIAWAETVRQQLLGALDEFVYTRSRLDAKDPKVMEALEQIRSKTEARWWIDHRGIDLPSEFRALLQEAAKEAQVASIRPAIQEAKAEATVRPEKAVTETVAEARVLEDAIEISFPERRDDFRELMHDKLHMHWANTCWRREIIPRNGTPIDRAVEAAHRLLAAGYPIRIFDPDIRARAISGQYEPECRRWVAVYVSGKYEGWFAVSWKKPDDFYRAAKRIGGARWNSPDMAVPPEKWEEVLDFARMYDFQLSASAQEAAMAAHEARDKALIVNVLPREEESLATSISRTPPKLEIPTEVSIDAEFAELTD